MKKLMFIAFLLVSALLTAPVASASESGKDFDPKEIIFEHLGDRYGWEVPFCHDKTIHLPIIVFGSDGLHIFSSKRVLGGDKYVDGNATFFIPSEGDYKGKVVEELADGTIKKPFNISITKNVLALFISLFFLLGIVFWLRNFYKRKGMKAPRRGLGAIEALTAFIYDSVIKSTLRDKAMKFAPYLLTVFYLIFIMNLLGLMVVFPGGANLTGNIAVTLVLALLTFFVTNIFATKHYWKDIFWPDVPVWLKFPIPIMQVIEVFGIFTKPAALTVRLFANMMGGHMIVIVLTLLIFIFADMGMAVVGGTTVVSVLFSIFMLLIDVLVSFIQAYVFTMLSTIFISLAQEGGEKHEEKNDNRIIENELSGKPVEVKAKTL